MKAKRLLIPFIIFAILVLLLFTLTGFFVIQPIGALPEGTTIWYFRPGINMSLIESADGMLLKDEGRICIITFHSLEDRIVKNTFIEMQGVCKCPKDFPQCVCGVKHYGQIINRKPITPNIEEQKRNPRSKSAKLRVFERKIES